MATREIATQDSYTNWAAGHPKPGYVYMDAATGKWKTEYSAATRVTLCVELERGEIPFFLLLTSLAKSGLFVGFIDRRKCNVKKFTAYANIESAEENLRKLEVGIKKANSLFHEMKFKYILVFQNCPGPCSFIKNSKS